MRYKIVWLCALLLLAACSNKNEEPSTEKSVNSEQPTTIENIEKENFVSDVKIEDKDNTKIVTIYVQEDTSNPDFSSTIESYYNELKKENKNQPVSLIVKNEAGTLIEYNDTVNKTDESKIKDSKENSPQKFKTQDLISDGTIELKENPITKQISVLIHLDKTTTFKSDSNIQLFINDEVFTFTENMFSETILQVNNLDYTEDELTQSKVQLD